MVLKDYILGNSVRVTLANANYCQLSFHSKFSLISKTRNRVHTSPIMLPWPREQSSE